MKNLFTITLYLAISTLTVFAQPSSPNTKKLSGDTFESSKTLSLHKYLQRKEAQRFTNKVENLFDSIYSWQWDTTNAAWLVSNKFVDLTYDAKNNLTSGTYKAPSGNLWVNTDRYNVYYDASNNPTYNTIDIWDGTTWVTIEKTTFIHDGNNNRLSDETVVWNGSTWVNDAKYSYKYDAKNNTIEQLRQKGNGNNWENDFLDFTTYDADSKIITHGRQLWDTAKSDWVNTNQRFETYDVNNLLVHSAAQSWKNNAWETFLETVYTYDSRNNLLGKLVTAYGGVNQQYTAYSYDANNNLLEKLDQSWKGSAWSSYGRNVYEYDSKNNNTFHSYQIWDGASWVNSHVYLDVYDQDSFILSESSKSLNKAGDKIVRGDSTFYYYRTEISGVREIVSEENKLNVYPNPSSGSFNIVLENNAPITKLEVYNMLGKLIRAENTKELNLEGEAAGVYLLKVSTGNTVYTKRITLE